MTSLIDSLKDNDGIWEVKGPTIFNRIIQMLKCKSRKQLIIVSIELLLAAYINTKQR